MKYNLKTGRFYFSGKDRVRDFKNKAEKSKTYRLINPVLYIKKPKGKFNENSRFATMTGDTGVFYDTATRATVVKNIISKAGKTAIFKTGVMYAVSVAVMLFMLYGSASAVGLRFSHEAVVAGKSVGIITDKAEFLQVLEEVEYDLTRELGRDIEEFSDTRFVKKLVFADDITNDYVLKRNLRSICGEMTDAYSIYADNEYVASAPDKDTAAKVLEDLKNTYLLEDTAHENVTCDFVQKVEIRGESVPSDYVLAYDELLKAVSSTRTEPKLYTVREGDNVWNIATKFNMDLEALQKANPNISGDVSVGDVINVSDSMPIISVRTSYVLKTEKSIPYTNERIDDPELFAGATEVVREGVKGKKNVVESVIEYNGTVVARKVESEEVLVEPVAGQIKVGSKTLTNTGSGIFIRPTEGFITSRFGARWGRIHYGIDIAAPKGQVIKAADAGVVTTAELLDSWGNLIVIDHGDGVLTYYAHCSEFVAAVGQNVEQGDPIARVGSTGNSTGPHLHFEVRYNGTSVNPEKFVDYQGTLD